ncbi:hypothetical protein IWX90DRAFT_497939 [Phyllosticta citrichinensis]|uniref:NAD-dependent epimerase/dehydratase domain-containing protein n=1 Tax=Phyllosticta citrichinensis TaxID=1130410 RepID=A0ABR1Y347_9PEZI
MADTASRTILVTGASGFVGAHVVNNLCNRGYKCKAAVRSESSAERVKKAHSAYASQLTTVVVPDIAVDGAFDDAVKDVHGIIHVANPVMRLSPSISNNLDEQLNPCFKGATSILESAHKNNQEIKRIVCTSCIQATIPFAGTVPGGKVFTEEDWSNADWDEAAESTDALKGFIAAKELAERAQHDFVEKNNASFNVTTLVPSSLLGPAINNIETMDHLSPSVQGVWYLIKNVMRSTGQVGVPYFTDVRDLAEAHVKAMEAGSEGGNKRYLVVNGPATGDRAAYMIIKNFPQLKNKRLENTAARPAGELWKYDSSKSKKELGVPTRTLKACMVDMVSSLLKMEKESTDGT